MDLIAHLVCALSLVVAYVLQTTIVAQTPLVNGTADLILLFFAAWSLQERVHNSWLWAVIGGVLISLLSAMPFYVPLIGYLGVVGIAKLLQRRVWQAPILAMFIVTLLATLLQQFLYVVALQVSGAPIAWGQALDAVIFPSVLLNLLFALPMFALVNDLVGRMYPLEVEA
jgi:rod shape-determining protein MreD